MSRWLQLVPRSWIFLFSSTLKMEAIRSSETSVYTISTRRHIPEDSILHSYCRENLKSYNFKNVCIHAVFHSYLKNAYILTFFIYLITKFIPKTLIPYASFYYYCRISAIKSHCYRTLYIFGGLLQERNNILILSLYLSIII
jgi:hypothetical protein